MSSPVTTINVVASDDGTGKLLSEEVEFIGSLGPTEEPEGLRPVLLHRRAESPGSPVQRFLPARGTKTPVLTNHGLSQSHILFCHMDRLPLLLNRATQILPSPGPPSGGPPAPRGRCEKIGRARLPPSRRLASPGSMRLGGSLALPTPARFEFFHTFRGEAWEL